MEPALPFIDPRTPETLERARVLLAMPVEKPASAWAGLGAAAFAAVAAVLMAGVMVLGPGVALENDAPPTWMR